jgi:hypothetical protein
MYRLLELTSLIKHVCLKNRNKAQGRHKPITSTAESKRIMATTTKRHIEIKAPNKNAIFDFGEATT